MSIDFKKIKKACDALAKLTDEEQEAVTKDVSFNPVYKEADLL